MKSSEKANIINVNPAPTVQYDRKLWISTGRNRFDMKWKNRQMNWSALLQRLQSPTRTTESYAEYIKASKSEQDNIKDVGGFVGGTLKDGKRNAHTVTSRSILSFDLDDAPERFWEDYTLLADYATACYSTHKHRTSKPRLRLLVPLARDVSADEYEAIARMLATDIGMDYLDPSTFQPSRLMYWPSCSQDADYFFEYLDAPMLEPDTILARYPDWTDASLWPVSEKENAIWRAAAERQQDPTTKKGVVGAFCRAYDIPEAIDAFLSDVYTATDKESRYTYAEGSTAAGLVVYDGGLFAFSNHATDPASGQLCNAFDLVRIHKFGAEDEDVGAETPTNKRPSYTAMLDFAAADENVRLILDEEQHAEAVKDFTDSPDPDAWRAKLARNSKGALAKSVLNAKRIFENDEKLQGIAYNSLSNCIEVKGQPVPWERTPGPWRDSDDSQLVTYVGTRYAEFARQVVMDQKVITAARHAFHPIREYLEGLPPWDGTARVDTLLIDYLGADDNVFTREATIKILSAAVRRVYEPGVKFDEMLVLSGPPNTGKSMLVARLGGAYFSDNLTFEDMKDKTAAEKLQGYWLLEISEMKGMRKMDVETIKAFISRQEDIYRPAYGHNTERHPRQCVIFGTVNDFSGYLKDITGNRRFWPIEVTGKSDRHPWDITDAVRDQIWAEVLFRVRELSETELRLTLPALKIAEQKQVEALESDDREGVVQKYLDELLPEDWDGLTLNQRLEFLDGELVELGEIVQGTTQRTEVSNVEIWCECFRLPINKMQKKDSYEIAGILKRLGWVKCEKARRDKLYGLTRRYKRPENAMLQED